MDEDEIVELLRRLFAMMTILSEDAATLAAEGQGLKVRSDVADLASGIGTLAVHLSVAADAALALSNS